MTSSTPDNETAQVMITLIKAHIHIPVWAFVSCSKQVLACIMMLYAGSGGSGGDGVNNPVTATGVCPQFCQHFPPKHAQLEMAKMVNSPSDV